MRPTGEEGTISRQDVERLLVRACPSFEASSARQEFHQDYDAEPEPPLYLLASGFVRHLAELNAAGDREEFPAVFDVIEDFSSEGRPIRMRIGNSRLSRGSSEHEPASPE
jgi:hypothetical protein